MAVINARLIYSHYTPGTTEAVPYIVDNTDIPWKVHAAMAVIKARLIYSHYTPGTTEAVPYNV